MNEEQEVAEQIRELDRDMVSLKISNAQLAVTVASLATQVTALQGAVKDLNDTMNRGKGALWGVMLIAGALGATLATAVKKLLGIA